MHTFLSLNIWIGLGVQVCARLEDLLHFFFNASYWPYYWLLSFVFHAPFNCCRVLKVHWEADEENMLKSWGIARWFVYCPGKAQILSKFSSTPRKPSTHNPLNCNWLGTRDQPGNPHLPIQDQGSLDPGHPRPWLVRASLLSVQMRKFEAKFRSTLYKVFWLVIKQFIIIIIIS